MHCATSGNCSLVAAAAARAHCMCGCGCTGITWSYVAAAPVSTCLSTSGAMISASSSELRHTSLARPLPQLPPTSTTPPGTTPPAALLAFALYAYHLPLCSSLCAPEILLKGHKPLVAAYAAQRPTLPSRRHGLVADNWSHVAQSTPVPSARFRMSCKPIWARSCTNISMASSKSLFGMDVARAIGLSATMQTFTFSSGQSGSSASSMPQNVIKGSIMISFH
jgi:hypothetical protein